MAWNVSIYEILAKSRAGILSRFQTAKDNLVFFGKTGPGSTSIPEMIRSICKTMMKNKAFLNFFGKCLSKTKQYLVVHDIFGGFC